MPASFVAPSATNTHIASAQATGGLVVSHSRNPEDFPFTEYVKYHPVDKTKGFYKFYRAENAARISQDMGARYSWPHGGVRPTGFDAPEMFRNESYETFRVAMPYGHSEAEVDQADFDILAHSRAMVAQQLMTYRGALISAALQGANWGDFNNTSTASSLSGGLWDAATPELPYISKGITLAVSAVKRATLGVAKFKDYRIVMNPTTATKLGHTQEMHALYKQSVFAQALTERDAKIFNEYGISPVIAGVKVVVDDCVRITSKDGASSLSSGYTIPDNKLYIVTRPGGIETTTGSIATSTVTMFYYKDEMTVYEKHDKDNERYTGTVAQDVDVQVIDARCGYEVTNLFS
jgi:hypothetical protein